MLREWDPFLTKALKAITYIFWQKKKFPLIWQSLIKESLPFPAFNHIAQDFDDNFNCPLPFGVDFSLCSFGVQSIKMIFHSYNPLYHTITFFL